MNSIGFMPVARPVHEKNDCVVRAYANATGTDYHAAHVRANNLGRRFGRGMSWEPLVEMYAPFGNPINTNQTIADFVRTHSSGTYIARIKGHVFAVKNGVVMDTGAPRPRAIVCHFWVVSEGVQLPNLVPTVNEPEYEFQPAKLRAPMPAFSIQALLAMTKTMRIATHQD